MNESSLVLPSNPNQKLKGFTSPWLWVMILVLLGMSFLVLSGHLPSMNMDLFSAQGLQALVHRVGPWGPVIYIGLLIISVVASQIPGLPLAIGAGAVWGPLTAGLYTIIGGFLGAMLAYLLGRYLGQPFFKTLTGKSIVISDQLATKPLGWVIFLSRLIPLLSFDLVSYGAGVVGLSLPIYGSATLVGMVPSTLLLTYMGGTVHLGSQAVIVVMALLLVLLMVLPFVIVHGAGNNLKDMIRIEET